MVLALMILVIEFAAANSFPNTSSDRSGSQIQKALSHTTENRLDYSLDKINETLENTKEIPSTPKYILHLAVSESETRENEASEKKTQERKHKAIFVDYPSLVSNLLHYPRMPKYEVDYKDNSELTVEDKSDVSKESDIFYIQLPPIPYMFVPGLGYISQPPTFSDASLKPQIPFIPPLVQLHHQLNAKPMRPQPASQQIVNPFIKVPIDFISNGKPISVYQWQKKPGKKPTDSPILNLDNLSANFVNNGKPTSIYQWQTNLKPAKRPDNSLNNLNLGPYTFNGKPTSMYLLKSDDTTSMHQTIRHPNY